MIELNPVFLNRMKSILGDEFDDFVSSLNNPMQKAVLVNVNKIAVDDFVSLAPFSFNKIRYEPAGFYTDDSKKGKHPLHLAGAFYSQEPSAMFTVNSMEFTGNEYVLDMCAAPGGKSIQIANRINNGVLVSNEIDFSRAQILYSNIERMGLKNVIVTNNTPKQISLAYANTFDVCLVDAPCSAEGMFRRDEAYARQWSENLPKMCASRQLEILNCADLCLKEGGKLIYSTCTYSLEENEQVVKEFLSSHDYKLIYINADESFSRGIDLKEAVRLYPHKQKGEGQFVALMQKLEKNENYPAKSLTLKQNKDFDKFLKENLTITLPAYIYNNNLYYTKDVSLIKSNINYLSLGVKLGKFEKDIFKPDHFLFSAFGVYFKRQVKLSFNDEKAKAYLHGEGFECDLDNGYCSVLIDNCAVGGAKIVNKTLKNHYPKGLRI